MLSFSPSPSIPSPSSSFGEEKRMRLPPKPHPSPMASPPALLANFPLISAAFSFVIAQLIKFFSAWYKENRWDLRQLVASGGMPSSHSATVTSLVIAIGCRDGLGSSLFATSMILACIVMYDAFGVRLHAGRQAEVLNQLLYRLPAEHPMADTTRPLCELLGHTPTQVIAGAALGLVTALTSCLINKALN